MPLRVVLMVVLLGVLAASASCGGAEETASAMRGSGGTGGASAIGAGGAGAGPGAAGGGGASGGGHSPWPAADCGSSALSAAAEAMAPGTFLELAANGLDEELLDAGGSHHILQYMDKGVWDPNTCQALLVGGGHLSLIKFIGYRGKDNTWFQAPNPSWWCDQSSNSDPYACSSHGYGHNAINPATGEMYFRLFNRPEVYRYQVEGVLSNAWNEAPPLPPTPAGCIATSLEYFPGMDKLVYVDCQESNLYLLGPGDGSWQEVKGPFAMGAYHTYAVYDRVHDIILFGGGNDSSAMNILHADGTVTAAADAPRSFHPAGEGGAFKILTADPAFGDYLAYAQDGDLTRYEVDTDTWSNVTVAAPTDLDVAVPISSYNVVMFLQHSPPRAFLYKHIQ